MNEQLRARGARVVQWWEHSPPTNVARVKIPSSTGPIWLEFVVSSPPYCEKLFSGYYSFPRSTKTTLSNCNSIWNARTRHVFKNSYLFLVEPIIIFLLGASESNRDLYADAIEALPLSNTPDVFGLHPNAEIGYYTHSAKDMWSHLVELQPQTGGESGGVSREEFIGKIATDIQGKLPPLFDVDRVRKSITDITPTYVVLLQELDRFNVLIRKMSTSLINLQRVSCRQTRLTYHFFPHPSPQRLILSAFTWHHSGHIGVLKQWNAAMLVQPILWELNSFLM